MPVCRRFANKIDAIPHLKPVKSGQITMIRCQGPSRQNHLCAIHSNSVLSISNFHQPPKNSSRKAHVGKTSPGLSLELAGLVTINSWACSVNPRNNHYTVAQHPAPKLSRRLLTPRAPERILVPLDVRESATIPEPKAWRQVKRRLHKRDADGWHSKVSWSSNSWFQHWNLMSNCSSMSVNTMAECKMRAPWGFLVPGSWKIPCR